MLVWLGQAMTMDLLRLPRVQAMVATICAGLRALP